MEKSILIITQIDMAEWIKGGNLESIHVQDSTVQIIQEPLQTYVMAYKDPNGFLRSIQENMGIYNTYQMISDIEVEGEIEVEIGVSKYYSTGQSETVFYKPKQTIYFLSEGISSLYISLRIRGSGTLYFKQITIGALNKVYWNEYPDKAKKLNQFYTWYEKQEMNRNQVIEPNYPIRIATILDEFSFECFKYEAQLFQLSYNHWREEIKAYKPEILLVESAWQGVNGTWSNRIARLGAFYDEELKALIAYCKDQNIPTVFWDKEGLSNFYYFINSASLFDYIGVTDENAIEIHQAMHPKENVFILPFAAQPKIHNSDGRMVHPLGSIAFAGSWYGEKYPQRIWEMENIVKPAIPFGVDIYDRNYDKQSTLPDERWKWPKVYEDAIIGKLSYRAMCEAYKQYDLFLNVQSVTDSEWMIPRRVYELLACGTMILSSYSKGIKYQFEDEVYISYNQDQTSYLIEGILTGKIDLQEKIKKAQEKIFKYHTYQQRLEKILEKVNY